MNNSTNKPIHKFNIVDVLIIIGVIVAIVFSVKVLKGEFLDGKIINVQYCIKIDGVTSDALEEYSGGELLYSTNKNIPIGVIEAVRSENMSVTSYNPSARRYITLETPNVYSIYLYITAGCVLKNGCYYTENIRISANTNPEINVPFLYDNAEIISVTTDDNQRWKIICTRKRSLI